MCQGKSACYELLLGRKWYLTLVSSDRKGGYSVEDMNLEMTAPVYISRTVARRFSYLFKGHFLSPLPSS
mgnify:CR=1 FL=1